MQNTIMNQVKLAKIVIFWCFCPTEIYCDLNGTGLDMKWIGTDDCLLNTQGDNGPMMPVAYGEKGTRHFFMYPDSKGFLNIKHDFSFKLLCSKSRFVRFDLFKGTEVEVTCLMNSQLMYKGQAYSYEMFECASIPKSELVVSRRKCQSNNTVVAVGFRGLKGLIVLYKVCFDVKNLNALYTWYYARTPYYKQIQKCKSRPLFKTSHLYKNVKVNRRYNDQKKTVADILQSEELAAKYIKSDGKYSLSRGHFAPKADFYYAHEQVATFNYVNSAPQWQSFNIQWSMLEKMNREMLEKTNGKILEKTNRKILKKTNGKMLEKTNGKMLEKTNRKMLAEDAVTRHLIVTGTYGSCTLPDDDGVEHPLFLDPPNRLPVPLFYWRVLYDMVDNKGVVYLGMNNPHKENDEPTFLCENVCPAGYQQGNQKQNTKSNIYCCTIESFQNVYGKLDSMIYEDLNDGKEFL